MTKAHKPKNSRMTTTIKKYGHEYILVENNRSEYYPSSPFGINGWVITKIVKEDKK